MSGHRTSDYVGLTSALLATSFSAILIRLCLSDPAKIAWYRLLGAGLIFLGWMLVSRAPIMVSRGDRRRAILAGIFLAAHFYLWISSLFMTTIHSSVVLLATQPLFALIFQRFFRGVPVTRRQGVSLAGGLVGAAILAGGGFARGGLAGLGDLFAIASAAMAAAYLFVGEEREGPLVPYLTHVYLIAGGLMLAVTLASGDGLAAESRSDYLWLSLLVVGPTLVGHSLLNRSTKIFSTYVVNLSMLSEPLLTGLWAWLIFREPVTANVVLGGLVILVSVAIEFYPGRRGRAVSRSR